jgi:superoxide dismutase
MKTEVQPLPFSGAQGGISDKTLAIHHDKLYAGYVAKMNEIGEKLSVLSHGGDVSSANQSYSELRGLKDGESFAVNGVYLHVRLAHAGIVDCWHHAERAVAE